MATNNLGHSWQKFRESMADIDSLGFSVDFSRIGLDADYLHKMEPAISKCYGQLKALEGGAIANPDENRQVGHYWLRAPELAPDAAIAKEINQALEAVQTFTKKVHAGQVCGAGGKPFKHLLLVGIGGSALGPRFLAEALGQTNPPLQPHFIDNTDPDGIDRALAGLAGKLDQTLSIIVSKSGSTVETRNGLFEVKHAYEKANVPFAPHAVAITQAGSALDKQRSSEGWLGSFPMWDWVGGRTSVLSAVGLLPLSLLGIDVGAMLEGAKICDQATQQTEKEKNQAMLIDQD